MKTFCIVLCGKNIWNKYSSVGSTNAKDTYISSFIHDLDILKVLNENTF